MRVDGWFPGQCLERPTGPRDRVKPEQSERKDYLSFGSRPSLVYCQQMSPIRSCTLALAIVTTVIGSSLSWLECRGR